MTIEDLALLFVRGLGSRGIVQLLDAVGSAEEVFAMSEGQLTAHYGLRKDVAEQIVSKECFRDAEREIEYCRRHNICIIAAGDEDYPPLLREAEDRPHVLFVQGNVAALTKRTLSMVGTREASSSGVYVVDKLVGGLAEKVSDLCIVSGLAYGIDAACHRAALTHNVATVAVVASVLPEVTPAPHRALADDILRNGGALVSELHSQTKQNGKMFISRNRIIAALSMGTVVVESPLSGGSLATADIADGYYRTVMAVPGRITDSSSMGSNNLIRSGKARMVLTANDIIEDMDWQTTVREADVVADVGDDILESLTAEQRAVLEAISSGVTADWAQLQQTTGLSIGGLSMVVIELEMRGLIRALPGQRYERI
ncbi:MAG: DNA-processing protein DprA [Alistipes sp.]|jgi:DNA processing protein|nr:DNA-processing protein DprA [Alistipes sp.]